MLYRALKNLSIGVRVGQVFPASRIRPDVAEVLLAKRTIAEVQAPPIIILCGWEQRDAELARYGIFDLAQLVEADPDALDGLDPDEVREWQQEAVSFLVSDPHAGECSECGKHK